jgi:very-short-patch-repair endonuclease
MECGRARKSHEPGEVCAPDHEKRGRARKSTLAGTVCSLDHVRARGEAEIERLAVLQHGCAHREQLFRTGLRRGAIDHRLRAGRYRLVHRAVYVIDPTRADEWMATMAAVLLFAGDGLVSGCAAGALWQLLEEPPDQPEVTVVGRSTHRLPSVTVHRAVTLDRRDVAWRGGMPVTSVDRTIVDLAGALTALELENAVAAALTLRLTTIPKIRAAMQRTPRARGIAGLRHLLESGGFARTRSHYERKLLALIARAGLPRPLTNHRVAGHEVDMVWLEARLVLEFDGFLYHAGRRAFERDRRRDQDLVAAGFRVIRVTARQVEEESYGVIARLAVALAS